jgi:hypothetical protein
MGICVMANPEEALRRASAEKQPAATGLSDFEEIGGEDMRPDASSAPGG